MFVVVTLWEIANLFGCSYIENAFAQELNIPIQNKNTKIVMLYVYLVLFLDWNVKFCHQAMQQYDMSQGYANLGIGLQCLSNRKDIPETSKLYAICSRQHRLKQAQMADFFAQILKRYAR